MHTHSVFSNNDALPKVDDMVARAVALGQPALAITDHGNMAASVQLYQAASRAGIAPFPGTEIYMVPSINQHKADYADKTVKATRFHLGIVAFTSEGYRNLVAVNSYAHRQHFHKPLLDFASLADLAESGRLRGLAATTGCFFGYLSHLQRTRGRAAAEQWLKTLDSWFDKVYVELQNHEIAHDEEWDDDALAAALLRRADAVGLPAVVAQDSHYLLPGDRLAHNTLKRLVAWGDQPDDAVFPGDGFHMADSAWMSQHHPPERLERGCEGLSELLESHALSIPVLDQYQYAVPKMMENPQQVLEQRTRSAMKLDRPKRYYDRLASELQVIDISGMAGYLLLVAEITDYMREQNIWYQTRGSAAGSLVCQLLGISNVDPLKWDLRFERFLSKDRTKPPDIDLDIEHERRQEVIAWLHTKFSIHQISTWARYSLEGEEEDSKGSLRVRYFATRSRQGKEPISWDEVPLGDKRELYDLADRKLYSGLGKNAAGVVITERDADFDRLVPLHHMSSGDPVAQYSKDDVESLGLVKMDVLGSKTLTVLRRCLVLVRASGQQLELDAIPLDDSRTYAFIREGRTDGIFQLEGGTTKRGLRELKPTTIHHVIAAMALFRPAVMKTGATDAYCRRKARREPTPVHHRLLQDVTRKTHGIMLYQEDVVDLMRSLGMEVEDLNKLLKAVKASNKDIGDAGLVIHDMLGWIETRCKEEGMTDDEVGWVVDAVRGFAEYSFNRAHATVYGLTAYRCAYLAVHHPLEFHCALLAVAAEDSGKDKKTGLTKEQKYLRATRSRRISVRKPLINVSDETYAVDSRANAIRKGYRSIVGVGSVSARELAAKQPFDSLEDLCQRVEPRKCSGAKEYLRTGEPEDLTGVIRKLVEQNVLETIMEEQT